MKTIESPPENIFNFSNYDKTKTSWQRALEIIFSSAMMGLTIQSEQIGENEEENQAFPLS